MFDSVLVANRGEIACRVFRTARSMGLRTIAIYSQADADALHVALADEAVCVGPAPVGESYLNVAAVLDAAARTGAHAIHPGYGFLSENAGFAQAVVDAGLVWVGPPPSAIDAMGDKARAKAAMRASGVPCVPGFDADDPSDDDLVEAAAQVGFPLLVKAVAGGGGRGMRRVDAPGDLLDALRSARQEALAAFGSGGVLLERLVEGARHVELQVMADRHGGVIHLGERDCSVQRRHQKVIEEAPSPAVSDDLRARMGEAACAAARAVDYVGAGTVEFLVGRDGAFYFLEMNTRLQVEHPVTEAITGFDLVAWQLRVAAGEPLAVDQSQVQLRGHAIEARIYAEDPAQNYLPQAGLLRRWVPPVGEGIRVDHGLQPSQAITPFYDPMVAKVIAVGPDRETARRRLVAALGRAVVLGLSSNRTFLSRVLRHPTFIAGDAHTGFLDGAPGLRDEPPVDPELVCIAAALIVHRWGGDGFRSAHPLDQPIDLDVDGVHTLVRLTGRPAALCYAVDGHVYAVSIGDPDGLAVVDGARRPFACQWQDDALWLASAVGQIRVSTWDPSPSAGRAAGAADAVAPTAGTVVGVFVEEGQAVSAGDALCAVEAMKIETTLRAGVAGTVTDVHAAVGATVTAGAPLVAIEPLESP